MNIRSACQQDAPLLAKLVYAAGPQVLQSVFGLNQDYNPQDFLLSALHCADGQYGFANHYVAVENEQVLASVCAWHAELSTSFQHATLHSVIEYFGVEHSLEVVARSQVVEHFIPPPQAHEWCIGHLAVLPQHQRQGIASKLLQFMSQLALQNNKTTLSLDVSSNNQGAIEFYLQQGFSLQSTSELTKDMSRFGFVPHVHMHRQLV